MQTAFLEMAAGETVRLASLVAECQKGIYPNSKEFCCGAQPLLRLDMGKSNSETWEVSSMPIGASINARLASENPSESSRKLLC